MNSIDLLNKLIDDADEEYRQKIIKILDVVVPNLDIEFRNDVAQRICFDRDRYNFNKPEDIILMNDGRAFDNPALKTILKEKILKTMEENKGLKPHIGTDGWWCETCGLHSRQLHPRTGYCFHCNTDNWEPEDSEKEMFNNNNTDKK